jgi:hypothetical protein
LRVLLQPLLANSRSINRIARTQSGEGVVEIVLLLVCGNDQIVLKLSECESSTQHAADFQRPLNILAATYCGNRQNLLIFADESF